jgi:hypothetical protein
MDLALDRLAPAELREAGVAGPSSAADGRCIAELDEASVLADNPDWEDCVLIWAYEARHR